MSLPVTITRKITTASGPASSPMKPTWFLMKLAPRAATSAPKVMASCELMTLPPKVVQKVAAVEVLLGR